MDPEKKAELLAKAKELIEMDVPVGKVAKRIGVHRKTLWLWLKTERERRKEPAA